MQFGADFRDFSSWQTDCVSSFPKRTGREKPRRSKFGSGTGCRRRRASLKARWQSAAGRPRSQKAVLRRPLIDLRRLAEHGSRILSFASHPRLCTQCSDTREKLCMLHSWQNQSPLGTRIPSTTCVSLLNTGEPEFPPYVSRFATKNASGSLSRTAAPPANLVGSPTGCPMT